MTTFKKKERMKWEKPSVKKLKFNQTLGGTVLATGDNTAANLSS